MEKYQLSVLFDEDERKKYAEWGMKKERFLVPYGIVTIVIDIVVTLGMVYYLFHVRERESYFSSWLSAYGDMIGGILSGLAIVLTIILIKPLDWFLDILYKKPGEPKKLSLIPCESGVDYLLTQNNKVLLKGEMTWAEWNMAISIDTNEINIGEYCLKIGANTIGSIYPKEKQHPWMDRPEEEVRNVTDIQTVSKIFEGYLLSLEEKRKEDEWIKTTEAKK